MPKTVKNNHQNAYMGEIMGQKDVKKGHKINQICIYRYNLGTEKCKKRSKKDIKMHI